MTHETTECLPLRLATMALVAFAGVATTALTNARADTISVEPGESIQAAIAMATSGDEIVVAPGKYHEPLNLLGKTVTLRSAAGVDATVLDAAGFDVAITCTSGETGATIIEGFTIAGGTKFASTGLSCTESTPTIRRCRFTFLRNGAIVNDHASPHISQCTFDQNRAGSGGAIHNIASSASITNCTFHANSAGFGGAICNEDQGIPLIVNCLFYDNVGFMFGGAMFNGHRYSPTIVNCTFVNNTASDGGALFDNNFALPILANCILWDNVPNEIADATDSAHLVYCDIRNGWTGTGDNNLNTDPLFIDPGNGDFRLGPASPCIDGGYNWLVLSDGTDLDSDGDFSELTPIDLAGHARFAEHSLDGGGCGLGALVDMGAYETPGVASGSVRLGDLDGDGIVNVFDLLTILGAWGLCDFDADCCVADLDDSSYIDTYDLELLLANWGP